MPNRLESGNVDVEKNLEVPIDIGMMNNAKLGSGKWLESYQALIRLLR